MTASKFVPSATLIALTSLGLSACTGSDSPDKTSDATTSSSESTTAAPKDRSEEVFGNYTEPKALAKASGPASLGIGHHSVEENVIFEVPGVTAAADTTLLQYQLTAQDEVEYLGMEGRYWYDQPALQVQGPDVQVQTVTASLPEGERSTAEEICVCTSVRSAGKNPRSQMTLYPPLPKDTEDFEVILPGLDPITVPVTR